MIDVGGLHFLRPWWLLALAGLPVLVLLARRAAAAAGDWRHAVDPHLLPWLLDPGSSRPRRGTMLLLAAAYALAVLALAGPGWRQVERPLWQTTTPVVVAVDLSSATLAADLPPSRLARVRARLDQWLREHRGGQVGLVAFAGEPFTVAPLTDDAANVALYVDALEPGVMPIDGQAADRAIAWSRRLLENAGFGHGRIVVVTDHADAAAIRAAREAHAAGYTVAALGVGTAAGAPVRTAGGQMVQARLDAGSLRALARAGGGSYAAIAGDGSDRAAFATSQAGNGVQRGRAGGLTWQDDGAWLLPPLLLVALVLLVRRRAAPLLVVACLVLPWPSRAADLWQRPDQQRHATMLQGVEAYRRGDFQRAADLFGAVDTADAHYDRGNALAKAGRLEDAIAAYDQALRRQPGMPDAIANREAVRKALQRRQDGQGGQQGGKGQDRQDQGRRAPGQPQGQPPAGQAGDASQGRQPPPDPSQQARADAAQRERMQRALRQGREGDAPPAAQPMTPAQRERRLADDAALRRVPDEPGSLLRQKFLLEYRRRHGGGE